MFGGVLAALCMLVPGTPRAQVTISISCSALGIEARLCREGAEAWAQQSGNEVRLVSTPNSGTERLALYQQLLAARSPDIDVFQVDVVWPGILANHLLDLSGRIDVAGHFEEVVRNNTVDGRLVAIPWFVNAGLLYYRRDLLEAAGRDVPETWQALTETARAVMQAERERGNAQMWGHVFQGRAYEGLTVNGIEWLASHAAGRIVEPDGKVSVDNPRAAQALALARSWIEAITPLGVLNYAEEESRGVFQSGNAVFMRNWPYAWPLLNAEDSPVRGKVGVAVLPRGDVPGGVHAAGLGGEQLAVSRYTKHPDEAVDLVRYLTSPAEQKRRAIAGGFTPSIVALYEDEELLAPNPFFRDLVPTLRSAVARPSGVTGARYNRVSAEFAAAVHKALAGQAEPAEALADLARSLQRIGRAGRW
ncbi:ABC transporter substrate-binding protein [Falsiroseomonas bella]|uniref:ABC transporter substrate-binding protein n=1 Tax=Falsiroseomonas bella TaxID=2184016 RepID=A0A317FMR0_9PROT|nr:ABC transporter substrate-binding protein [Falsiroseomonas bella]PWS38808.1 ABC transporter substrate-binding protein [Falsiroseomonas bella]